MQADHFFLVSPSHTDFMYFPILTAPSILSLSPSAILWARSVIYAPKSIFSFSWYSRKSRYLLFLYSSSYAFLTCYFVILICSLCLLIISSCSSYILLKPWFCWLLRFSIYSKSCLVDPSFE